MNCSKWALTLAELDASDLIRLVSHSVRASSWRTGPSDTLSEREKTQRAAACSGLRITSPQDMWRVLHTYTPPVFVCVFLLRAWRGVVWPRMTMCLRMCASVLTVCAPLRGSAHATWYLCVFSSLRVLYGTTYMHMHKCKIIYLCMWTSKYCVCVCVRVESKTLYL